jgi:threonylcarbamoyladenosine tRNA methylthiotransferase MtaB
MNLFTEEHRGETRIVLFEHANKDGSMEGYTDNYIKVVRPYDASKVNTLSPETI